MYDLSLVLDICVFVDYSKVILDYSNDLRYLFYLDLVTFWRW